MIDYVERYSTLFDQLKAYTPNPYMRYYTIRFIDGLHYDIRVVVAMLKAYVTAVLRSGSEVTNVHPPYNFKLCRRFGTYSSWKICLNKLTSL